MKINGGQWTEARMRAFVKSALRGARWGPKYDCIKKAFVEKGVNPTTGRKASLHRCSQCRELVPRKDIQADHIEPVIGPEGFVSWDVYIKRLFVEADKFRALCKKCHQKVTNMARFKVDEEGLKRIKKVRRFADMKTTSQTQVLRQLNLPVAPRKAERIQTYREYIERHLPH